MHDIIGEVRSSLVIGSGRFDGSLDVGLVTLKDQIKGLIRQFGDVLEEVLLDGMGPRLRGGDRLGLATLGNGGGTAWLSEEVVMKAAL